MCFREGIFDHFTESEGRNKLFLLYHRDAHHLRLITLHHRTDQHIVNIAINIDLIIIEGFNNFARHKRFVYNIGFDGGKTNLRRVITQRDQTHRLMQAVGGPL